MLLRLAPGPAEALFGITAAPMAAVADWHGRVVRGDVNLRGDVAAACALLRRILQEFDRRAASRPPPAVPPWAAELLEPGGTDAVAAFLDKVHPRTARRAPGRGFAALEALVRTLELEGQIIAFAQNFAAACESRAPAAGREYGGYEAEVALLRDLTFAKNDAVKFKALEALGRFGPVAEVAFFERRAAEKAKDCRNPNVVLCRCLSAVGDTAKRLAPLSDRRSASDRQALLALLPFLADVLDAEGRNNGACACASGSIAAIAEATGAPEALEAYLHNFRSPKCDSDWMREHTAKYHDRALAWIRERTGQGFGADEAAWKRWYDGVAAGLVWDADAGRFVVNPGAAKAVRARVASALRGR